ncbi:16S rRNA (guanine(966)-N(2))-methyltransferase RsmD [Sulfitobacter sp. F26204]|uniref:16S rRNA (guanine(966)-N(2))-methyltransferase RsmD n=1 Tax=Sulfitobacter sp. F26204 TaxID=2996014 RepID=UPI00225DCDDE|nr:16S rRNA (guanine(966)-N(2))-methyltransferase RsmD [Sulfitobacter sp. F26204]MCX7558471.1 16S rRNA (guanine(966)-N(2))-methyltransferase RsmD [Sulfitobacter sp. F26204]
MRIIAGAFRGRVLAEVGKGDAEAHLRPTSDRVRESLFSMLTHHNVLRGARVLDLFAGTGALGFEALSRGAQRVCFVENGRVGQRLIGENIAKLGVQDKTALMRNDATRLGSWSEPPFDLVFLDPPYGKKMGQQALQNAQAGGWLAPTAMIIWEENTFQHAPEGFTRLDRRKYGDTHVTLLEVTSQP